MMTVKDVLDQATLIVNHYGIEITSQIAKFGMHENYKKYYAKTTAGIIFIEVNTETFKGKLQFYNLLKTNKTDQPQCSFIDANPVFKKFNDCFLHDCDIFNAFITQHDNSWKGERSYGRLLDLLDVSLVFPLNDNVYDLDTPDFLISYHTNQSCSKLLMLEDVSYLQYENVFEFSYKNFNLQFKGDYEKIYNQITAAYHLKSDSLVTNFSDLGQLTLMRMY